MLLSVLSAALSLLLAGPSVPPAGHSARAAVEAQLRAKAQPGSATEWRALGSGVEEALVALAGDSKVDLQERGRAVSALGLVATRPGLAYLEKVVKESAATTDAGEKFILRKAAVALGWTGGAAVPGQLGPLLQHSDPDVRLDAAIGLGLTRSEEAADLLRARFDVETVPKVRSQIGRQLAQVEQAIEAARKSVGSWPR
jgi:HEAT repeat protein